MTGGTDESRESKVQTLDRLIVMIYIIVGFFFFLLSMSRKYRAASSNIENNLKYCRCLSEVWPSGTHWHQNILRKIVCLQWQHHQLLMKKQCVAEEVIKQHYTFISHFQSIYRRSFLLLTPISQCLHYDLPYSTIKFKQALQLRSRVHPVALLKLLIQSHDLLWQIDLLRYHRIIELPTL